MAIYQNRTTGSLKIKMYDYQRAIQIKNNKEILICNWARGLGASYTIMSTILKERPEKVLYFSSNNDRLNSLKSNCESLLSANLDLKNSIKSINYCHDNIKIIFHDQVIINIINWYSISRGHDTMKFDYIFFDELLPVPLKDIISNRIVSFITTNNYDNHLEVLFGNNATILNEDYNTGLDNGLFNKVLIDEITENILNSGNSKLWYRDYAIMDNPKNDITSEIDKNSNRKYDLYACCKVDLSNKFLIDALIGLEEEYDLIPKTKDTVMTRKNLLEMITQMYKNLGLR